MATISNFLNKFYTPENNKDAMVIANFWLHKEFVEIINLL